MAYIALALNKRGFARMQFFAELLPESQSEDGRALDLGGFADGCDVAMPARRIEGD
jgi:hypothetical protein